MKKTDKERLKKIVLVWDELCDEIEKQEITEDVLLNERFAQWAITTPVFNIGEQVSHISSELKDKYYYVPWSLVSGLRNRLVHDYDSTNWCIISKVVFHDMPEFISMIKMIISEIG